ncbi:hypothetical protein DXG01_016372 [Tephrocybe rancida]|nr:hypothetical protein DXG01_016372 [Tephrocybe rancida]
MPFPPTGPKKIGSSPPPEDHDILSPLHHGIGQANNGKINLILHPHTFALNLKDFLNKAVKQGSPTKVSLYLAVYDLTMESIWHMKMVDQNRFLDTLHSCLDLLDPKFNNHNVAYKGWCILANALAQIISDRCKAQAAHDHHKAHQHNKATQHNKTAHHQSCPDSDGDVEMVASTPAARIPKQKANDISLSLILDRLDSLTIDVMDLKTITKDPLVTKKAKIEPSLHMFFCLLASLESATELIAKAGAMLQRHGHIPLEELQAYKDVCKSLLKYHKEIFRAIASRSITNVGLQLGELSVSSKEKDTGKAEEGMIEDPVAGSTEDDVSAAIIATL